MNITKKIGSLVLVAALTAALMTTSAFAVSAHSGTEANETAPSVEAAVTADLTETANTYDLEKLYEEMYKELEPYVQKGLITEEERVVLIEYQKLMDEAHRLYDEAYLEAEQNSRYAQLQKEVDDLQKLADDIVYKYDDYDALLTAGKVAAADARQVDEAYEKMCADYDEMEGIWNNVLAMEKYASRIQIIDEKVADLTSPEEFEALFMKLMKLGYYGEDPSVMAP